MKKIINRFVASVMVGVVLFATLMGGAIHVMAASNGLTLSPMNENIIINPGESYQSSFKLSNPVDSTDAVQYELSVEPFYIDDKGETTFKEEEIEAEHTQMVDWIVFDSPTKGKLEPNQVEEILFTINVPQSASAGGQYAMVTATALNKERDSSDNSSKDKSSTTINEVKRIGHLVYAEITGKTIKQGQITDINVSGFLLSGDVTGSASIKNTGNVHGNAKFTLQVFPLFSGEEVYSNEESPAGATVLPNKDYYAEIAWEGTPDFGIFNVVFRAEFEGEVKEVTKLVIKIPVWLLFVILFVIFVLIIWIVTRIRNKGKVRNTERTTTN